MNMENADVVFYPGLFSPPQSDNFLTQLSNHINWRHEPIKFWGKDVLQPRLTAYYGDKPYRYSGIAMQPASWTPTLLEIKSVIEPLAGVNFNAVLINLYRDGNDRIGWHSDDEKDLAHGCVIGSVSFGATRRFLFRRRDNHHRKIELLLHNGDFLMMAGTTQQFWQHQVPKTAKKIGPRINLTFRVIK
ncbi:MAG: alpha-ketoglutarate-dependent dioxygenase AlkB [Gomphosphaeria aponina SAG 52.96 = DSM 107014]|uniref:Alpha-ketoglutarate-dependent dioxygenase AlkB n=1 Tax=Gomphosphaeria aponina SAG 52.96 = DSM 107014 TaxID=1521640 RepID=A0A941GV18_9CHRO|nr:alpha-ketoglutarate-dependent dioxygenase AlkB [Gomphosphaeria aponina SAG 52.96 = DSM 107014]